MNFFSNSIRCHDFLFYILLLVSIVVSYFVVKVHFDSLLIVFTTPADVYPAFVPCLPCGVRAPRVICPAPYGSIARSLGTSCAPRLAMLLYPSGSFALASDVRSSTRRQALSGVQYSQSSYCTPVTPAPFPFALLPVSAQGRVHISGSSSQWQSVLSGSVLFNCGCSRLCNQNIPVLDFFSFIDYNCSTLPEAKGE